MSERPVTLDEARRALLVAAKLVDLYGAVCIPIFERAEQELIEMERRGSVLDRARHLVLQLRTPLTVLPSIGKELEHGH